MTLAQWVELSAVLGSAAAAVGALITAVAARTTAVSMARLEHDRRREELTPVFAHCIGGGPIHLALHLELQSPRGIEHLDEVKVEILDDRRYTQTGPSPTQEQLDAIIWGPFRFRPLHGASEDRRSWGPFPLQQFEKINMPMESSARPSWIENADDWMHRYGDGPFRCRIHCRRGDYDWIVPMPDIDTGLRSLIVR